MVSIKQSTMKLKHVLLMTSLLLVYLCIGAAVFRATEQDHEVRVKMRLQEVLKNFTESHNNCVSAEEVYQLVGEVIETGNKLGHLTSDMSIPIWDFAGAFSFAVTVVTTIGYGHIFPGTVTGRSVCVIYAFIGIPLTLVVLGGIGEQLIKLTKLKTWSKKPDLNRSVSCVIMFSLGLVLLFVLPSLLFWKTEGWEITEGLYYCFITFSAIGFGDYIAGHFVLIENEMLRNIYRIAVYLWIFVGLSYLTLVIKFISRMYVEKGSKVKKEANRRLGSQRLSINNKSTKSTQKSSKSLETISDFVTETETTETEIRVLQSTSKHRQIHRSPARNAASDTDANDDSNKRKEVY